MLQTSKFFETSEIQPTISFNLITIVNYQAKAGTLIIGNLMLNESLNEGNGDGSVKTNGMTGGVHSGASPLGSASH